MPILLDSSNEEPIDLSTAFTRLYRNLRYLARSVMRSQNRNHTWGATDLIHETYRRMASWKATPRWDTAGRFLSDAARDMERALIDYARRKQSLKRGGGRTREAAETLENFASQDASPFEQDLAFFEQMERLDREHPVLANVTRLRVLGGFTNSEIGALLGCSADQADRLWRAAKLYLAKYVIQNTRRMSSTSEP